MLNVPMKINKSPTVALDYLGCKLNQAEIQELARQLEAAGYTIVDPEAKADIYVLNTCSVTGTADSKSRHLLRQAKRRNSAVRLVAIGCYAQRDPKALEGIEGVELVLDNDKKMGLAKLLGDVAAPPTPALGGQEKRRTRSFVKIQQGCRNFCSYCIVPYMRNKEASVSPDKVIALVKKLAVDGAREIVLTGTEIGAYGSNGVNLEGLIKRILAETYADAAAVPRIRVSSLQPHQISPSLIGLWQNPRLCPHFHLSLQSGSDAVLKRMKRKYTSAAYRDTVSLIRSTVPEAAITTDVIVGFPGETEAEFQETMELCKVIEFARIHVFPFSPRPGTAAAVMPEKIPDNVKKDRTDLMLALAREAAKDFHQGYTGKTSEVLWEQPSAGIWSGYTGNYIKVYQKSADDLTNNVTRTKLVKLYRDGIWGEITQ
jgi:threonylcarbamoyladenosine tRNA methylthiotransferase MtaB